MDPLQWVKASKKGDTEAFYQLMKLYQNQCYKIAFSYLRNEQEALEAVQETTYRAFKNIRKLKEPQYFRTWLIRILINYCIDEQKRHKRSAPLPEEIQSDYENLQTSDHLDIQIAVEQLEPKYRQIILLKYFEDLTISDIADIMERPEGTIKTWLNQALNRLRSKLGERGEHYV